LSPVEVDASKIGTLGARVIAFFRLVKYLKFVFGIDFGESESTGRGRRNSWFRLLKPAERIRQSGIGGGSDRVGAL